MTELKTDIYGLYGGFIPIAALIDQCAGIRVERVTEDCMNGSLKIMGTLVPRSPHDLRFDKLTEFKTMFYGRYEKIIVNPPATIVIWNDGTKTVVKATENDIYDPEKGVALCFLKKYFASYKQILKDANDIYEKKMEEQKEPEHDIDPEEKKILEALTMMDEEIKRREQNIENRSV